MSVHLFLGFEFTVSVINQEERLQSIIQPHDSIKQRPDSTHKHARRSMFSQRQSLPYEDSHFIFAGVCMWSCDRG